MYRTEKTFLKTVSSRCYNNYSWYHFLSLYLFINKCAELENCCASLAIRSVLSSSWLNLSPRSSINWCALLTSDEAEVARRSRSCKFAFGPGMCLATDLFAFPLDSPTKRETRYCKMYLFVGFRLQKYTYKVLLDPNSAYRHRKALWRSSPSVLLAFHVPRTTLQAFHYIDC